MTILTRSAAKKAQPLEDTVPPASLNHQNTLVVVSPSATGEGLHTRWHYPAPTCSPMAVISSQISSPLSCGSSPSLSSLSSSSSTISSTSSSVFSESSFYTAFSGPQIPQTPTRQGGRTLQRTPDKRWDTNGGTERLISVPDSHSSEDVNFRESIREQKLDEVFETQWHMLMAKREIDHQRWAGTVSDSEDDMDTGEERVFVREDTVPVEDETHTTDQRRLQRAQDASFNAERPRGPRLGPHGTELIEVGSYPAPIRGSILVYPTQWANAPSTGLNPHPTELVN